MYIHTERIKGFVCSDSLIEIFDNRGKPFYYKQNPTNKAVKFNLPVGSFITDSRLVQMQKPVVFVCPELPKPDKNIEVKPLIFIVAPNPNKCSIDVNTGRCKVDPSLWNAPKPYLNFVLFHEIGHYYYKGGSGESSCDCFAATQMLEHGFNLSQVEYGQEFCLSDGSLKRKDLLYEFLKKVKVYA